MKGKKRRGCCLGVLLCVLALVGLFIFAVGGGFCDFRFETYREWYQANEQRRAERAEIEYENPMPSPESLGDAQSIIFQQYTGNFWGEKAHILIARYDADVYEMKRAELDQRLVFQTEAIEQYGDEPTIEPAFDMDGFHMRFAKLGRQPYWLEFPKEICLIGTSDEACEIAYIYYDDVDLDCVSQPMEIELPKLIHWSSVRWQEFLPILKILKIPVIGC